MFDERFFNDLNDCGVGKKVNFTEGGKGGVKWGEKMMTLYKEVFLVWWIRINLGGRGGWPEEIKKKIAKIKVVLLFEKGRMIGKGGGWPRRGMFNDDDNERGVGWPERGGGG